MVSTGAKLVARARQREAATTARSFANAFDQKQSSFARRAEEDRIKAEAESNMFEVSQHRSAPRVSNPGFRGASGRGAKFQLSDASESIPTESLGANLPAAAEAEPVDDSRSAKRHRFEEVIATSRRTRADFQKEREERHKETDELDAQFEGLLPLLPKRDKRQEDVDRFRGITRPEVQTLLDAKDAAKPVKGGRRFVLSDDGNLTRVDTATEPNAADTQRMEAIKASILEPKNLVSRESVAPQAAVIDEFDAMLGSFKMEMKRAQPVDRVLLPEEEAVRDIAQQLMEMDRERRPELKMDYDRTRTEWVDAGGDSAFQMEDADDGTHNPLLGDSRQRLAVDDILAQVEEMCTRTEVEASAEQRAKTLAGFASALWHAANKQKRHAEDSFKLLLIDAQRRSYKGLKLSRFHHTVFYLATKLFPCTDFRHPVTTPLSILLSHLCMNTKLMDLASCAHALWYASLLLHCLQSAKRFASECVIVALNVISMQLPRPSSSDSLQFPVLERSPKPILQSHACEAKSVEPLSFLLLEGDHFDSAFSARRGDALVVDVLGAAYNLLLNAAETFGDSPSFEAIFHCFVESLHKKLAEAEPPHPLIRDLHTRAVEQIATLIASNAMERTPLAMRTFRPRPLRQFEPLMVDDTPTVKKELQLLRQEVREDHRRVMRTLQAEARVEQRDRDALQARTDERKKAKLDTIMAELQQQQHVMKDADALRTKAAGKKRAAKDVVPKTQNSD